MFEVSRMPKVGDIYEYYENDYLYEVVMFAYNSEKDENCIIYKQLFYCTVGYFVESSRDFLGDVIIDGKSVKKFKLRGIRQP